VFILPHLVGEKEKRKKEREGEGRGSWLHRANKEEGGEKGEGACQGVSVLTQDFQKKGKET